jgi:hypothetical protein
MSVAFRQKFLNELEKESNASYRKIVSMFFDRGAIRLERSKWDLIYQNAYLAAMEKAGATPAAGFVAPLLPTTVWQKLFAQLQGTTALLLQAGRKIGKYGDGDLVKFHKPGFKYTDSMITMPYVRGKSKNGKPYNMNLERRAELDVKKFMTAFCNSRHFVNGAKSSIKASQQEYEHGATGEQDFRTGARSNLGTPRMNTNSKGVTTLGGGSTSDNKGAQGTVTDQRIAAFLIEEAAGAFSTEPWFDSVFEAVFTKWADIFGYDTELDAKDKKNSVKGTVIFKGAVVPVKTRYNPGKVDRELLDEFKAFVSDPVFWKKEVMRLNSMIDEDTADQMFSDSPGPRARMEDAAIKLAAAGILDNLNKKFVKNRAKVGKPKSNTKKGRPTKSRAKGRSSSSVNRRGGRVTKKTARGAAANTPGASALALKELINAALPEEILDRMGPPALTNRTGRFRRSAQVTNVLVGPRGGVEAEYTYMRDPYSTFEPGGRMGSTFRDPRKIIGESVREIATKLTGNKFIKVRRI